MTLFPSPFSGKKCLFFCGDRCDCGKKHEWLQEDMKRAAHQVAMWKIKKFEPDDQEAK